ncbi:MAG: type II toxin-antitoxin system VapC family toxin [Phycisphaeraceae bacterium]
MERKPTVYVETTVPSYLTSWPSTEPVMAGHQKITREWWLTAKDRYDLYVSDLVILEMTRGDADASSRRLTAVEGLPVIGLSPTVLELAQVYESELHIPLKARNDAVHLALAVVSELDYLVTWNCAHLANGHILRSLREMNDRLGLFQPTIVTPESLMPA